VKALANKLSELVYQENPNLTEVQRVKIRFGLEGILQESTKVLVFLLLFSVLQLTREYLMVVFCLAVLRPFLGGYHAKTNTGCYLVSLVFFTVVIFSGQFFVLHAIYKMLIGMASFLWAIFYSPVEHPRNPFPNTKKKNNFKIISLINICVVSMVGFLLDSHYSTVLFLALGATMIMAVLGLYLNGKSTCTDSNHNR
jgi:accessory gene regulator B